MPERHNRTALIIGSIVVGMFGLAYASVPLYSLFCKATGFGGTPRIAEDGASHKGNRIYTVRFDANTETGLAWRFRPEQKQISVKAGENTLIFFSAENLSDEPITGTATFNVAPDKVGTYFNKVECFCFTNQTLQPHQKISLPVSFFIDPAIENDETVDEIRTITLSYSFFRVKKQAEKK